MSWGLVKTVGAALVRFFYHIGRRKGRTEVSDELAAESKLHVSRMKKAEEVVREKYDKIRARLLGPNTP